MHLTSKLMVKSGWVGEEKEGYLSSEMVGETSVVIETGEICAADVAYLEL
jgi:hypothetical protein